MSQENTGLGVLNLICDIWDQVNDRVVQLPPAHFAASLIIQIAEALEHIKDGDKAAATKEVVDIISVSLNWLRAFGLDRRGIEELILLRLSRYADPVAIMDKYRKVYGI